MTTNEFQMDPKLAQERGGVLGYSLIGLLALLTVAALIARPEIKNVVMGVYLMVWGFMFLASYYFSHKTFFLRGLLWFCLKMACPSTPKMAFFYAFMGIAMGAVSMASGFGLI